MSYHLDQTKEAAVRPANIFLLLMLILRPSDLQYQSFKDEWVAWNIGQGQWVTHIKGDTCLHYDVGGEISYRFALKQQIQKLCFRRENKIFVSHWDLDHFSLLTTLVKWVPRVCWMDHPAWPYRKKLVSAVKNLNLTDCIEKDKILVWRPRTFKSKNESSGIVMDQSVLIPGDSPIKKEREWIQDFTKFRSINILVLGHHGSRTSTGKALLKKLINLKTAIASARYEKYHHPHWETLARLQKNKVPVLKTEDWGHIHWQN